MDSQNQMPFVLMIMLCTRCALGGAEKRYARIFEMLVAEPGAKHKLLINRSMLELLQSAGILVHHTSHLIVLDPPFERFMRLNRLHRMRPVLWLLEVLWLVWQCFKTIHRIRPQVVHPLLTGMYLSLPALLVSPKVYHVMSAYTSQYHRDIRILGIGFFDVLRQFALRRCHLVDALSVSIQDTLIARKVDARKIRVAPNSFTDVSLCQPAAQRKKWVVFVARFIELKNPLLLARAIPQIVAQNPDVHFYFLGQGDLGSQLESTVRDLQITKYVTIRFEPLPTEILNQSSIFVSLQEQENYPSQSLLEAMACGNAIVATDVGETWRLVDESNGVRVPATVDAVAEAIISLLKNSSLQELGYASRLRVLSKHTPERFFEYITDVYQAAVATGK